MRGYVICLAMLLVSGCWFDFNSDIWHPDLIECKQGHSLDFGPTLKELPLHYEYKGNYSSEFSIGADAEWLSIYDIATNTIVHSGKVDQNNKKVDLKVVVDRSLLDEGDNAAVINFEMENIHRTLHVSAYAKSEVLVTPASLNFGLSSSIQDIALSSFTAVRVIRLSSDVDWLSISTNLITIENRLNDVVTVAVACDRSNLASGLQEGHIIVKSEKETFVAEIPVMVYVPEQEEVVQTWNDFIFTISESPFRDTSGGVVVNIDIKNVSSMYRSLTLNASGTMAYGEQSDIYYTNVNRTILVKPGEIQSLSIAFSSVPENVNSFAKIVLDFTETQIQFDGLTF